MAFTLVAIIGFKTFRLTFIVRGDTFPLNTGISLIAFQARIFSIVANLVFANLFRFTLGTLAVFVIANIAHTNLISTAFGAFAAFVVTDIVHTNLFRLAFGTLAVAGIAHTTNTDLI